MKIYTDQELNELDNDPVLQRQYFVDVAYYNRIRAEEYRYYADMYELIFLTNELVNYTPDHLRYLANVSDAVADNILVNPDRWVWTNPKKIQA